MSGRVIRSSRITMHPLSLAERWTRPHAWTKRNMAGVK